MSIQYKNSDYKNFENIISDNEQKVAENFSLKEEIKHLINSQTITDIRLYFFQTGTLEN